MSIQMSIVVISRGQPAGRSLGMLMILDRIQRARKTGLPYVDLGYWVDGSRKMGYKRRFGPQEHLGPRGWARVD